MDVFTFGKEADYRWNLKESLIYLPDGETVFVNRNSEHGELLYRFLRYKNLSSLGVPLASDEGDSFPEIDVNVYRPRLLKRLAVDKADFGDFIKNKPRSGYYWQTEVVATQLKDDWDDEAETPSTDAAVQLFFHQEMQGGESSVYARLFEHIINRAEDIADKTRGFVGRRYLSDGVASFIDDHDRGYFVLTGDPGIGKTAFMAHQVMTHDAVHHFNIRSEQAIGIEDCHRNLAAQLIVRYGLRHRALPARIGRDASVLKDLMAEAAKAAQTSVVLYIDALDESAGADVEGPGNILALPLNLPKGVFVIMTSRRIPKLDSFRAECPFRRINIDHDSEDNLSDVQRYLRGQTDDAGLRRYMEKNDLDVGRFTEALTKTSEGNFMYLFYVVPAIRSGVYRNRSVEDLPQGLRGYYEDHWIRMRSGDDQSWRNEKVPVIVALTIVREPVPLDLLAEFTRVQDRQVILSVIHYWQEFLHIRRKGEPLVKHYRVYHDSFHDFIKDKDEVQAEPVDLKAAHERIAQYLWRGLMEEGVIDEDMAWDQT